MTILQQQASDVRITEINMSSVVTSASSSVAAQIIVASQGRPEPRLFTNAQDYLNEYGNPNAQVSFDVYCGLDYFKEGNQLWGLRVAGTGALWAGVSLYGDGSGTHLNPITAGIADVTNINWPGIVPSAATPIAAFYPIHGQGSYGDNIAISIQAQAVVTPTNVAVTSINTGGTLVPATYTYQVSALGTAGETLASSQAVVVIAGVAVTNSAIITWNPVPLATGYRIYGRTATTGTVGLISQVGQGIATFTDTGGLTPDTTKLPITNVDQVPAQPLGFVVSVYDLTQSSVTAVENFVCTLVSTTDSNGQATGLEELINPFSQYIQVASNVPALLTIPVVNTSAQTAMAGGASGAAPTNFQVAGAWNSFANKQLYAVNLLINSGKSDPGVQLAMDTLASGRGDAVALLDVPSAMQDFQSAINYRNLNLNLNSTYSALFNPDVLENDTINGKQQYVPFSGWAAALCARTDRVANAAYSIAGLNRGLVNVLKARYTYDDGQATAMFRAQVNYTRTFIGQGIALWEQQTLAAQQSALSWLSVRRIVNVMKVSLYNFALYSIQEPNDDFTGRQIVSAFTDYLTLIQNARGISSFTVVSDSSNNTAATLNSAIRVVTVIIVPILPIHEIDINMVVSKQGVSFTETLNALSGSGTTSA